MKRLVAACSAAIILTWVITVNLGKGLAAYSYLDNTQADHLVGIRSKASLGRGNRLAYYSLNPPFKQEYAFGRELDPIDPTRLAVINHTNAALDDIPDEIYEFSASFEVVYARARTRDHYYIAGHTDAGEDVIERWKKASVGMPGGGGAYVMNRKELYRGTSLNGVKAIGIDPQGQILLIVHDDAVAKLSRLELPGGGQPSVLYDEGQIPHLGMLNPSIFPRQHATEGIVWTVEGFYSEAPSDRLLFHDYDEDGELDAWEVLGTWDYWDLYGINSGVWTNQYVQD